MVWSLKGLRERPKYKKIKVLDLNSLRFPTSYRLLKIKEAFKNERLYELTKIDPWFLNKSKLFRL